MNARRRVVEILEGQNACSDWYRARDPNPAATFQTIGYALDDKGEKFVQETRENVSEVSFRHPYVASVMQATGSAATITLNAHGAFFKLVGPTIEHSKEGGILKMGGYKMMQVGPYPGDSAKARLLTLLHEFGHALDMLPVDFHNVDGKSMQNSLEVLRYCQTEIEAPAKDRNARSLQ